jgi:hypothetical protein
MLRNSVVHQLEKRNGRAVAKHAKSLMRMLGPKGSPSAENLSRILTALQRTEGVRFTCDVWSPAQLKALRFAETAHW